MRGRITAMMAAAAALCLAGCAKPEIPYPQLEARYASAASRFADLPGGLHVHYRDEGRRDAPALVMVHGFAASLQAWEPWRTRLAGEYRVISLDLPGHGLTRAPAGYHASAEGDVALVDELTRNLGVERFVLIGNSMGGAVAWRYALAHPERLRGLVLVDAAGWPGQGRNGPPPLVFQLLSNPAGRALLKSIDPTYMTTRGLKAAYLDPALVTPALVARYTDMARAPGHKDIMLGRNDGPRAGVTAATFAAIRTPTLVMAGADDRLIPSADARALAAAIPGAKLVVYPGVGHVPMEQIPDRSAADLRAFLAALPAEPPAN